MVTKAMLLSIWDLNEEDETMINDLLSSSGIQWTNSSNNDNELKTDRTNDTPSSSLSEKYYNNEDYKTVSDTLTVYCGSCGSLNREESSWCIECGTCLSITNTAMGEEEEEGEKEKEEEGQMEGRGDKIKLHEKEELIEEKKMKQECILHQDMMEKEDDKNEAELTDKKEQQRYDTMRDIIDEWASKSNTEKKEEKQIEDIVHEADSHMMTANNQHQLVSARLSPYKYTRKWRNSSSAFYMWQKPSSVVERQANFNEKLQISQSNSLLPLSSPQSDSLEPSTVAVKNHCSNELLSEQYSISLLDLPDELILYILSHLSSNDLMTCSLVCKRLHQVTFDPTLYGREITLTNTTKVDMFKRAVVSLLPSSLILKQCNYSLTLNDIDTVFTALNTRLKKLTLDTCYFGPSISSDIILIVISQNCPSLVSLELQWTKFNGSHSIISLIENCTRLEELKLIDVSGIVWKDWTRIAENLSNLSNLQCLHIILCPELPLSVFTAHQYSFLSLKTLAIRQNINLVSLEDIHVLVNVTAPNVKFLKLECIELCTEIIQYLVKKGISFIS